jgi:hypothetical protein
MQEYYEYKDVLAREDQRAAERALRKAHHLLRALFQHYKKDACKLKIDETCDLTLQKLTAPRSRSPYSPSPSHDPA